MAVTISKIELSGSTDGRPIKVTGTATGSSVTIHTAQSGTTADNYDEIWLWANNTSGTNVILTLEWGGTTSPDDLIEVDVAAHAGVVLVAPGLILQNSLVVKAFAATANVINITGFVNRITSS